VARAEAYLRAKFHLDPSNRLATTHQRHRQTDRTGQTAQRSDSIGRTVLETVAEKFLMAALWNRAGHYTFALWFLLLSSIYLSFFSSPNLSRRRLDVYHTFHTWCGVSANLECRSETCCTWLAESTGRKKSPKNPHLGTIAQLCQAISLELRHVSTIGKKLLNSNNSSTCPDNMVNLGPLAAEIGLPVSGTPANFNGFRVLAVLLHGTVVVGVSQTLRR